MTRKASTMSDLRISIEYMTRTHIAEVADIEEETFLDPWLPVVISYSVRRKDTSGIVALVNGEVVGYAIYQLRELEGESVVFVSRLAVAEEIRFCGIGGILLDDLIGRLTLIRRTLVFPVRESNLIAQLWLREYGLHCVGIEENHFANGEAAYVFEIMYDPEGV